MTKKLFGITMAVVMIFVTASFAAYLPNTQITKILESKAPLSLTESQIKKLQIIEITTQQKLLDAKTQADIRLSEIEKFTSNWKDMNSIAVQSLLKEYYDFMASYKIVELEAIIKARTILNKDQLSKFQEMATAKSMIIQTNSGIISSTITGANCCSESRAACCPNPQPNCCPNAATTSCQIP